MSGYIWERQGQLSDRSAKDRSAKPVKAGLSNSAQLALLPVREPAAGSGNVIQRTVDGKTCRAWLSSHNLTGEKKSKFQEFFDVVHREDSFVFFAEELDSYCEPYFSKKHSQIPWTNIMDFDRFKKHVAMLRDPEGAHGGERHTHEGDKGTQYIYNRVLGGGVAAASYLPLDTFLRWDSKLIKNHEEIFEAYKAQAVDLVEQIMTITPARSIGALRTKAANIRKTQAINIGGEILTLTISSTAGDIQPDGHNFRFAVKASIVSNHPVDSISITQAAALAEGMYGAVKGQKNPEAHTGGLAPVFTVNDNDYVDNDDDITPDMLKWVTKY